MILNKTNVPTITLCFIIFIDTRRNVGRGLGYASPVLNVHWTNESITSCVPA